MLKIFLYCSYSSSPVGFVLGSIDEEQIKQDCHLTQENIPLLVQQCFTHGIIYEAWGRLPDPDKEEYLVLKKKILGRKEDKELYCNVAFWGNAKEYCQFKVFLHKNKQKIIDIIQPDSDEEQFGLTINKEQLDSLFEEIHTISNKEEVDSDFFIQSKSSNTNTEEIAAAISSVLGDEYEIKLFDGKLGKYVVKKKRMIPKVKREGILISMAIIILVLLSVLSLVLRKQIQIDDIINVLGILIIQGVRPVI